jgi:ADP-glucose pyrophosphorylase
VEETAVWDDVTIGAHATLVECIVADGVTIPAGAAFTRRAIVRANQEELAPRNPRESAAGLLVAPL